MSEPPRLRASALRLRRFRRPLAFALAVGSAGGYADGYRSHAFVGSYGFVLRLIWWANSETSPACRRTRPHQDCGAVCHGSCILSTAHPHIVRIRKKGGVSASLRDVKMSDSQAVLHGLQRRIIQRLGRIRHRKIEEPDRLSVTVLALHDRTTAPRTRNLRRVGSPSGIAPRTASLASRVVTRRANLTTQLSRMLVGILSAVGFCVRSITHQPAERPLRTMVATARLQRSTSALSSFERPVVSNRVWHSSITTDGTDAGHWHRCARNRGRHPTTGDSSSHPRNVVRAIPTARSQSPNRGHNRCYRDWPHAAPSSNPYRPYRQKWLRKPSEKPTTAV